MPTLHNGYANVKSGQLHYQTAGAQHTPAVLLHQTASSARMFSALQHELAADWHTVAWDTPGFGSSTALSAEPCIEDYAQKLREATHELGFTQIHLVGHHTGAAIATYWAANWPDEVLSLTMMGALALGDAARADWHAATTSTEISSSGAHLIDAWHRVANIDASPVRYLPTPEVRHREATDTLRATPGWEAAYRAVFSFGFEAALSRVTCPIQLICGDEDILAPYIPATAALMGDGETHILPAGAYLCDEHPELLASLMARFWARTEPTEPTI